MWSIFETRSILFHSRNICLNRYICGIRNSPSNANSIFCCKTHHKGRIIGRRLWKEPIVPQKRSVSRTLDKKHQTKPPAFTESAGPRRVLPAASTAFFSPASIAAPRAVHREKDCPEKGKLWGDTRVPVVIDTSRMHCPFTDRTFFCSNRTCG